MPGRFVALASILDRAHPPVARLRVMSAGLSPANTLKVHAAVAGSAACISCGNCVDACPVLADRGLHLAVMRTSMSLESLVGADCRRCYRCVQACPQVEPFLKEATRAHRRVERVAHYLIAVSFVVLSLTGLAIYYIAPTQPPVVHAVLGALHRGAALGFLLAPLLLLLRDPAHARRTLGRLLRWTPADARWLGDVVSFAASRGRRGRLMRGDLNPAQRLWYLLVLAILLAAAPTGALLWLGEGATGAAWAVVVVLLHTMVARVADVGVLSHVGLKVGWPVLRNARNLLARERAPQHGALWPAERRATPFLGGGPR